MPKSKIIKLRVPGQTARPAASENQVWDIIGSIESSIQQTPISANEPDEEHRKRVEEAQRITKERNRMQDQEEMMMRLQEGDIQQARIRNKLLWRRQVRAAQFLDVRRSASAMARFERNFDLPYRRQQKEMFTFYSSDFKPIASTWLEST